MSGAPVMVCSSLLEIWARADGESLGLIFLEALRQAALVALATVT